MSVKALIFDLYGTLIRIHTDEESIEHLWKPLSYFYGYHGAYYTPEALLDSYRHLIAKEERKAQKKYKTEAAEIKLERVFKELFTLKGAKVSSQTVMYTAQFFRACSTKVSELYPGVQDMFYRLKQQGIQIYLLSNAQRIFTEPEMKRLGIYESFDEVFISSDWNFKKPSPTYFRYLLDKISFSPKEIMMVGNSPRDDIVPAYALGLQTCFLNTDGVKEIPPCTLYCDFADYETLVRFVTGESA